MRRARTVSMVAAAAAVALASYLKWLRPWQLRWGATDDEVRRALPGDDLVPNPTFVGTRAVSIDAPPELVWPWVAQIGFGRAGWYSYDWVDNFGRPSARRVLEQYQHVEVGDLVPVFGEQGFYVRQFVEPEYMLWWDKLPTVTWLWALEPDAEGAGPGRGRGRTRLVTRVRMRYRWAHPSILFSLVLDVGDIIMMRKCMLGIRERAEALAREQAQVGGGAGRDGGAAEAEESRFTPGARGPRP